MAFSVVTLPYYERPLENQIETALHSSNETKFNFTKNQQHVQMDSGEISWFGKK